ncbi:MAG: aminotransferase class V-fold PLP-dependent enzyme [Clostridia bacterium]|nr:aminotransferase class V-fold PLP-dependent enzyme [Clostridia bacterium]
MIYFDNAATTFPKPPAVTEAVVKALKEYANPGRGGHIPSNKAAEAIFNCRIAAAELFGIPSSPEKVVFTNNATHALNIAIKSILNKGGHAVISGYEHNSVIRPLESLRKAGVTYSVARSRPFDTEGALVAFKELINKEKPDCVIVNHVSNVYGNEMPVKEIDEICNSFNIPMIIDASQSAGSTMIDESKLKSAAYICMPGHKGLYGPHGTGILLCCKEDFLYSLIEGGTGSNSRSPFQPDYLPDVFESGTPNVSGIAGLSAGISFLKKNSVLAVKKHQNSLLKAAKEGLSAIKNVNIISSDTHTHGVLSFNLKNADSETVCEYLSDNGICVRGGLHCAPLAHECGGTVEKGTVRLSFSVFNTEKEIAKSVEKINRFAHSFY